MRNKQRIYEKIGIRLILGLGVLLRIVIFLQNHSIQLDEANLARNIIEKPFGDFFQSLDYQQYAPPLFLVIEKANTLLFGPSEYALRLFPLLVGMGSLFLFYQLAKKLSIGGISMLFVLFVFSFSEYYWHYANEAKQYSSDVFISLLLTYLALTEKRNFDVLFALKWSAIGIIAVWSSMPAVFVLAGVGFYFFYQYWTGEKTGKHLHLFLTGGLWLLAFGVYYFSILQSDMADNHLQAYHREYFLKLPLSIDAIQQDIAILLRLLTTTIGHTAIALGVGFIALIIGLVSLLRKDKKAVLLIFAPVFSVLVTSVLHKYSLIPRLTLFFTPLLLLIIGLGVQLIFTKTNRWQKIIFGLLLIATAGLHDGIKHLWQPYNISDIKSALHHIQEEWQSGDALFVNHETQPAFYYYAQLHPGRQEYRFEPVVLGSWNTDNLLQSIPSVPRLWVLHSHLISQTARQKRETEINILSRKCKIQKEWKDVGVGVVLMSCR